MDKGEIIERKNYEELIRRNGGLIWWPDSRWMWYDRSSKETPFRKQFAESRKHINGGLDQ